MDSFSKRVAKHSPEIFHKSALERNELVYIPQFLCQASLPKTLGTNAEWMRSFNRHKYTIIAPSRYGIPGGSYSRLIFIRINTLAKHSDSPTLHLGNTASKLMQTLGLDQRGDTIKEFKKHFLRCINCVIHTESVNGNSTSFSIQPVITDVKIISDGWHWSSEIVVSDSFYQASQKSVPTDWGALKCLAPGTLRMDIFNFLVYRLFYLRAECLIPWRQLHAMFCSPDVPLWAFKPQFNTALAQAKGFYRAAKADTNKWGLKLDRSQNLIQPIR
jgi:hypothetical protein